MNSRRVTTALLAFWPWCAPLLAQERIAQPKTDGPQLSPEFVKLDREVGELAQQLGDWSSQYSLIDGMLRNVWEGNGWNSESDLFARDTALEISQIPPWKFPQRINKLTETIDTRYQLNDAQRQQLQVLMNREALHMMATYGPTMLGNFREMLQTRLDGRPISPEQVARWETAMDPLVDDLRKDVDRLRTELGSMLDDDQRKILDRDLQSANKRLDHYLKAREGWKRGEWQANDWGMQHDPIQTGRAAPAAAAAGKPQAPVSADQPPAKSAEAPSTAIPDGVALPYDESTWEAFVRAFIAHYELDAPQEKKCLTILDGLVDQARHYRQRHKEELDKIKQAAAMSSPVYEPIRMLFLDLKNRLNPIPTDAQVRAAATRPPPKPPAATGEGESKLRKPKAPSPPKRDKP